MPAKRKIKQAPVPSRPPVVTVMGHVDHGKTTLLDALRKSRVAQTESGGITQHIGAYQVVHNNRKITFIDTPGHAAFAAMRARGAKVTDVAVVVIDAVESVKPQTKESLQHIAAAKVPFLIALNKMDLPGASEAVVKKDLADAGVMVEGYGGDIVCVPVSAKTGKGMDSLLEMILLVADMRELPARPNLPLKAIVIESMLDNRRGPVATIIVKEGTLKVGEMVYANQIVGKVKALFNEDGKTMPQIGPGDPALILGLKQVPEVGAIVTTTPQLPVALPPKEVKAALPAPEPIKEGEDGEEAVKEDKLKLIIRADVAGTLEAIVNNLGGEAELVASGIGNITESDVLLAQSTGAKILAFRVPTVPSAKRLAEIEKIVIKPYSLIHELLDDISREVLHRLEPTIDEQVLGEGKIIAVFTVIGKPVAGIEVESGRLTVGNKVHLMRLGKIIGDSQIKGIHQGKESINRAKKGEQCGISLTTAVDFKVKDKLVAFTTAV